MLTIRIHVLLFSYHMSHGKRKTGRCSCCKQTNTEPDWSFSSPVNCWTGLLLSSGTGFVVDIEIGYVVGSEIGFVVDSETGSVVAVDSKSGFIVDSETGFVVAVDSHSETG